MLTSLGGEPSAAGIARHYAERHPGLVDTLVIDEQDAAEVGAVAATGIRAAVGPTVMRHDADRRRLAEFVLDTMATALGSAKGLRPSRS
jgi:LPPG:FO 2-phospho-L-lactate transferase